MKRQKKSRDGGLQILKSDLETNRSKRAAAQKVEQEEVEEGLAAAATTDNWAEEWPWLRGGVVDEQMSWGYITSPKWGVEFMAEAYGDLFSDVVWEDDIWNLKSIQEIPANP